MIDMIINKFLGLLNNFVILSDKEKEIVKYSLTIIIADFSKTIVLFSIFAIFNIEFDFLIILIYSTPLRITVGGFHMKSYLSCLLFSTIYFILIWLVNHLRFPNQIFFLLIGVICSCVIFKLSPQLPKERLNVSTIKKNVLRKRSISLSMIYLIIYVIINNPYTRYGVWIVIIQSILILIARGVNSIEKCNFKKSVTKPM